MLFRSQFVPKSPAAAGRTAAVFFWKEVCPRLQLISRPTTVSYTHLDVYKRQLPPDLITFSKDAAELLADLQSRNEMMFLLTFTVVNMAPTRQRLENDVFTVGGIAQKYNLSLIHIWLCRTMGSQARTRTSSIMMTSTIRTPLHK